MPDVLSIMQSSMLTDMQRLEVVSHNLANATTPGYKREIAVTQPFGELLDGELLSGVAASSLLDPDGLDSVTSRIIDHGVGSLRNTGNPLDVAIEGDGYLMLEGPDGPVYTRRGSLSVDAKGKLIGAEGLPVLGVEGEILLRTVAPRIDAEGVVWEGDDRVGELRIARFSDPGGLTKLGSGVFRSEAPGLEDGDWIRIRQGHLENSNVSLMEEMVLLIAVMRRIEASQRVVQGYDDTIEQTLRTIGDL